LSLFAKGGAALLVGSYSVSSGASFTGFTGGQEAERTITVPVLETELGAKWRPSDRFTLSAGWLFQAWIDLGVSGGTFYGTQIPLAPAPNAFGGADDANIMSFDGLFVRAQYDF
jgi:hypothetical protein